MTIDTSPSPSNRTRAKGKQSAKGAPPTNGASPKQPATNGTTKPQHPGPGRPTIYTPELGREICELTAMRVPLVRICEMPGMPSERTVYAWKRMHPEFQHEYARAREHRADARADRIDEIAEELRTGKLDASTARTLFDVERWQAGREKPAVYGDRIDARLSDLDGKPLQVTSAVAIAALLEAMPELVNGKVLNASAVLAAPTDADGGSNNAHAS
jgi:hypothetical protein